MIRKKATFFGYLSSKIVRLFLPSFLQNSATNSRRYNLQEMKRRLSAIYGSVRRGRRLIELPEGDPQRFNRSSTSLVISAKDELWRWDGKKEEGPSKSR